jgi:hypothetical protein
MLYVQGFTFPEPIATFLAALVAAAAAIAAASLTTWRALKSEQSRIKEDREKVLSEDLSDAIQQLTIKMAASLHSMCWLTWLAKRGPNRVDKARLELYDSEQHQVLPEILGHLSTVAALDADMHNRLRGIVYEIYALDEYIGRAGLLLESDPQQMIRNLVAADKAMTDLEMQLPQIVGDVVSKRVRKPEVPDAVSELTRASS